MLYFQSTNIDEFKFLDLLTFLKVLSNMQFIEGKKAVKQLFANQYFHTPTIPNTQQRFYLIKIESINDLSQSLKNRKSQKQTSKQINQIQQNPQKTKTNYNQSNPIQQQKKTEDQIQVTFEVGYRSSSQTFNIKDLIKKIPQKDDKQNYKNKKQMINKDKGKEKLRAKKQEKKISYHIFPYEREQVMSITIRNTGQKFQEFGYALMPLVPFIKMAQIKHQIQINLVSYNDRKQIKDQVVAKLNINLYFLYDFKGKLIVQPIQAQLSRNLAQIGQMAPILRLFLREYSFMTDKIDEGGMRPNWQSPDNFCYFNIPIKSAFDELFLKLYYRRQVTIDQQIGNNKIDLQNGGFFKEGLSMSQFLKRQQNERNQQKNMSKIQNSKNQQTNTYNAEKIRKQTNVNLANLNKNEKKDILAKQKKSQLEKYQIKKIQSFIDQQREFLVQYIIRQETIINSMQPPLKIADLTEKIYLKFQEASKQIQTSFQKESKVNIYEFVGEDLQQIKKKSMSSLKGEILKQKIKKMLVRQIKTLMDFASQNMNKVDIALFSLPTCQENTFQRIQVGILKLKYLFLYQFQISLEEEQDEGQDQSKNQNAKESK